MYVVINGDNNGTVGDDWGDSDDDDDNDDFDDHID